MKRKRHTPEPIIRKLREADGRLAEGKTIAEINQRLEISEQTFHRWRNQYGGSEHDQNGSANGDDMKHLKALQTENHRLKKLVADLSLDKQILEAERDRRGSVKARENGEPDAPQG